MPTLRTLITPLTRHRLASVPNRIKTTSLLNPSSSLFTTTTTTINHKMGSTPSTSTTHGFTPDSTHDLATFGAGCFWGVEKSFQKKFGKDLETLVGYAGGSVNSPSYKQVCTGTTGHAEVLQVKYNKEKISYEELVDFFFRMHDPTTKNRQGGDTGPQYRSTIFYHSPTQATYAKSQIDSLQHHFGSHKIVTTVEDINDSTTGQSTFWNAEDYHQDYLNKNPHGYECPTHFERSWERIHELYGGN